MVPFTDGSKAMQVVTNLEEAYGSEGKSLINSFEKNVNDFGPDDYFSLKRLIETNYSTLSIRDIFAVIRLSGYDAHIFKQMTSRLLDLIPEITGDEKWNL